MATVHFLLNGAPVRADVTHATTLLQILRDRCGITSVKDGCAPSGQCGACAVLVDGQLKTSCAFHADKLDGRSVITHQGLLVFERSLFA